MKFYSTRDKSCTKTLREAAFAGLAPDGGLFMPERMPQADMAKIEELASDSYAAMASYLAGLFFSEDIPQGSIDALMRKIYDFPCPLVRLDDDKYVLELFHGPTFAFKDFGARFMGGMLGLLTDGEPLTVLTATSGDTGSAVAAGFYNVPGVRVIVLYPEGKVSPLQEAQMTTLGGNITAVRVRGNFDDCQALVKAVFNDRVFRKWHRITSANSINVLRWIPQSFYYWYGWVQWKRATGLSEPEICVPSGNYGNITSGMLASRMGLPVKGFIAAANANDVVPKFLAGQEYTPGPSVRTVANAMDVGAPSNFERMMDLFGGDAALVRSQLRGCSFSDTQIKDGIVDILGRYSYTSDPHSTTGFLAMDKFGARGFYLSTAHPAKFSEVISEATGRKYEMPPEFGAILSGKKEFVPMDNNLADLKAIIHSEI